jgi:putative endopeptidase
MRLLGTFVFVALPLALAIGAVPAPLALSFARQAAVRGFDPGALDRRADPCGDFYQFACGGWMANNPVPADQSQWGRFDELEESNRATLRAILDKAAQPAPVRAPDLQKIGDYYASCMDEPAIEAKALGPLQPALHQIDAMQSKADVADEIARLHAQGVGVLFGFGAAQDFKDATQVIAVADQGGLALPDRDYYLNPDARSAETRQQYTAHVQKMFELAGASPDRAAADAATVLRIETGLAKGALDRVARRNPTNVYHKMSRQDLAALAPAFDWTRYFAGIPAPPVSSLNVTVPDFFKAVNQLLTDVDLAAWRTYFTWHLLHANAEVLPSKFVDENFNFYGRTLTGTKEQRPRWKRCVDFTDGDLGEALGKYYVDQTFGATGKQRALQMVHAIETALGQDIRQLDWMTPATREQALVKLQAVANKIGYPDKWRDYRALDIVRGDALGNSLRANVFEFRRQLSKIGKPVDRGEWGMTPPTVNAYYNPLMNDINFPAGILQPPFFDKALDDAVNFGAIGAVIGHELTHGFDDQGRRFDANGNLRDWWTPDDATQFEQRTACMVRQYSSYVAVGDVKLNGQLTLGENTADNGGVRLALMALAATLGDKVPPPIDGFTPTQRFFLGWGQIWCQNRTDEVARVFAKTDPHSPGRYRVNGVVANMPEFQKTFGCKPDAPTVNKPMCRLW